MSYIAKLTNVSTELCNNIQTQTENSWPLCFHRPGQAVLELLFENGMAGEVKSDGTNDSTSHLYSCRALQLGVTNMQSDAYEVGNDFQVVAS